MAKMAETGIDGQSRRNSRSPPNKDDRLRRTAGSSMGPGPSVFANQPPGLIPRDPVPDYHLHRHNNRCVVVVVMMEKATLGLLAH